MKFGTYLYLRGTLWSEEPYIWRELCDSGYGEALRFGGAYTQGLILEFYGMYTFVNYTVAKSESNQQLKYEESLIADLIIGSIWDWSLKSFTKKSTYIFQKSPIMISIRTIHSALFLWSFLSIKDRYLSAQA